MKLCANCKYDLQDYMDFCWHCGIPQTKSVLKQELDEAFKKLLVVLNQNRPKTGPKPVKIKHLREELEKNDYQFISLNSFSRHFTNVKRPRKEAANNVSWLKTMFNQQSINIEISSRRKDGDVFYYFYRK